jgi:hypothetical protein
MSRIALVDKRSGQIMHIVDADEVHHLSGPWGSPTFTAQVAIPENADESVLSAMIQDDEWIVYENEEKIELKAQAVRNKKLATLRSQRNAKLEEADTQIKKHEDQDFLAIATPFAWRSYRIELRQVTDGYKHEEIPEIGLTSLDQFDDQLSTFEWPEKPS